MNVASTAAALEAWSDSFKTAFASGFPEDWQDWIIREGDPSKDAADGVDSKKSILEKSSTPPPLTEEEAQVIDAFLELLATTFGLIQRKA